MTEPHPVKGHGWLREPAMSLVTCNTTFEGDMMRKGASRRHQVWADNCTFGPMRVLKAGFGSGDGELGGGAPEDRELQIVPTTLLAKENIIGMIRVRNIPTGFETGYCVNGNGV